MSSFFKEDEGPTSKARRREVTKYFLHCHNCKQRFAEVLSLDKPVFSVENVRPLANVNGVKAGLYVKCHCGAIQNQPLTAEPERKEKKWIK